MLLISLSSMVFAQSASVVRLEVPAALESGAFHLEPVAKKGVLVFYESNEISDAGLRKWYFGLFDTQLKQIWLKFIPIHDGIEYVQSVKSGMMVHFLFRSVKSKKSSDDFYEIVSYNTSKEAFSNISGTIPEDAEVAGFEAIDDKACLGLNLKKEQTDVLFINLNNGAIEVQTLEAENESYIETIAVDHLNKNFYVAVKYIKDKNSLEDKILKYSDQGTLEETYQVQNPENFRAPRNFVILPVKNNILTILGTYDFISGKTVVLNNAEEDREANSAGMFFLQFKNGEQKILKFYDFMNFDNIYGSLHGREMVYAKKPADSGENQKPEKKLSAFFYFNAPQVLELNDQYIFSVETYKPIYNTETRMEYDFYGRPMPRTYSVFEGYQFYDLIIASLSEKGELIWNNDFEIKDLKSFFMRKQVTVFPAGEFLSMAYVNNGSLYAQTIDGPIDISKEETPVESKHNKDWISEDENNAISHWYGEYFLIYGYQKIKNRSLGDQSTRTVFYVNKVAYN
ncbi:MAG: hypothetical protein KQH67_01395 [Bacteroidetes bacterium]|nr:hypothetical protein [Bacteroidota bacterium]